MVRVDFYKVNESGAPRKWYTTEAVSMEGLYGMPNLEGAIDAALMRHLDGRFEGMIAVVADPYHQYAHPMVRRISKKDQQEVIDRLANWIESGHPGVQVYRETGLVVT